MEKHRSEIVNWLFQSTAVKFILLTLLLVIAACSNSDAESKIHTEQSNEKIESLIDKASNLYDSGEYEESNSLIAEAESLLTKKTDTSLRIRILINKSEILKNRGNYQRCIKNYYEAVNLSKLTNDTSYLGLAYYNISSTYLLMKNLENADKYNSLAQEIYKKSGEESRLINCKIVRSSIYRQLGESEKAKRQLEEAIEYYISIKEKGEKTLSVCFNNYANLLLAEEEYSEAISYYLKGAEIHKKTGNKIGLAIPLGNIGEAYLLKGDYNSAKNYIDSSLILAREMDGKETILSNLERLISYYRKTQNLHKALSVYDEYIKLKTELLQLASSDDIFAVENRYKQELKLVEASNKIDLLKKDNVITRNQQQRTRFKLYFFVILTLTAIVVGYILYKKQKKIRQVDLALYNREREILATKNQLAETEKQQLEKEIEFKRSELRTFSINILEREKFLTELKDKFSKIKPDTIPSKEILDDLKQLFFIKKDDSVELFKRIQSINSSFHFNLKSNYPELTDDDIRLASLILLGLSSKEISNLLSIEPKSVNMKKYRLKMKLRLDAQIDLKQFLDKI